MTNLLDRMIASLAPRLEGAAGGDRREQAVLKRLALACLLCAACPRGRSAVPILNYHSVGVQDEFAVSEAAFAAQLDWLSASGVKTLALHEALAPHQRAVVLTFDDGKEDALTRVLPALKKHGMRAVFFIPTSLVRTAGFLTSGGVRA